jgi:Na+/H+ antiporter NhaC
VTAVPEERKTLDTTWTSIIPPLLAVVLAFITREAVISLTIACLAGVLLMGHGIQGFPALVTRSLGTEDFVWVCGVELCIGVLVAFLQRSGAVNLFTSRAGKRARNRRQVGILGWALGLLIFFSDYFSPLFVGPVMRNLTDKYQMAREKLAYICDSTSAPLAVLMPFSAWAAYLSGLAVGAAGIHTKEAGLHLFVRSLPFNFYSLLSILFVFLIVAEVLPDFGPMRTAEERARKTGKLLRDGAVPMMGRELTELEVSTTGKPNIVLNFWLPVAIIVGTNIGSFILTGTSRVLESFMLGVGVLAIILWLQKIDDWQGIMRTVYAGMKGVMPAVVILALAFCINSVSKDMHTAEYVIGVTQGWMSPGVLPALVFLISAIISFATGTSWGTYAIVVPIALPLAYQFSGQQIDVLVLSTFAAVAGGGVFGDHCSPLSDTTVLSSLGSACDHMDHVRTQLPYALAVAAVAVALYLIIGFI